MWLFGVNINDKIFPKRNKFFNREEKALIDKFYEMFKKKFKQSKYVDSYYYKEERDRGFKTDTIQRDYQIGRKIYQLSFDKYYIWDKRSQRNMEYHDLRPYPDDKNFDVLTGMVFNCLIRESGGYKRIINYIKLNKTNGKGYEHYFYIPTRYSGENYNGHMELSYRKKIIKTYFLKLLNILTKRIKQIS